MDKVRLYNKRLDKTEYLVSKDDELYKKYYHLSTEVWIINSNNQLLLLKNNYDYSKRYPGLYTCLGGNIINDEEIENTVVRLCNEIGIKFKKRNLLQLKPVIVKNYNYAFVTCILKEDINKKDINLGDSYSNYVMVDKDELMKMCNNGEIAYYLVDRIKKTIINYMK